jgi:hypothetical protein
VNCSSRERGTFFMYCNVISLWFLWYTLWHKSDWWLKWAKNLKSMSIFRRT